MATIEDFNLYLRTPDYDQAKLGKRTEFTPPPVATARIQNTYSKRKEESRQLIYLKAGNDKYVCADQLSKGEVVADRDEAYEWETFTLILFGKNECAVTSSEDLFMCNELNNKNRVTASRLVVSYWETFIKIDLDSNYVAFKSVANDMFISVDEKSNHLYARAETIGRLEKFKLEKAVKQ